MDGGLNMRVFLFVASAAIGVGIALSGSSLAAANIVENGDFASGLNDWTVSESNGAELPSPVGSDVGEGCNQLWNCTLSQTLVTTPAETYALSFDFNPGYCVGSYPSQCNGPDGLIALNGSGGNVTVSFGGNQVAMLTGGLEGWTSYSYLVMASSTSTVLSFVGYQNPDVNALTEVSVSPAAAIPEASTWAMLLVGFAGLGFAGYRASQRTAAVA
jgi:hypothetical protein